MRVLKGTFADIAFCGFGGGSGFGCGYGFGYGFDYGYGYGRETNNGFVEEK